MRILAGFIILFLLLCFGGWMYIKYNKASILEKVKKEINSRISGEISIGNIDASFFQTFPTLSIGVYNITLKDSLWKVHHHTLFQGEKVFAELNIFRMITGHLTVRKIIIENASAYLFTDTTGYSNETIFKKSTPRPKRKLSLVPDIEIKNSTFIVEKANRNKYFSFSVAQLEAKSDQTESGNAFLFDVDLSSTVHSLAFNRNNGSFVEEKPIGGKCKLQFNPTTKILQFDQITLNVDHHPFLFSGKFFLSEVPAPFLLNIETSDIEFRKASSFLTQNIRKKLDNYNISGMISSVRANLDGTEPENRNPIIHLKVIVRKNDISTPVASFTNCAFAANFTNEWIKGQGHADENSIFRFTQFSGEWQKVAFHSDTITITNLLQPKLSCDLHANFDLTALNNVTEDKIVQFSKGNGAINVNFKGPLQSNDSSQSSISGNLSMDSAALIYQPRNFALTNCSGRIRFDSTDLYIDNLTAHAGSSDLTIKGAIRNLFTLITKNGERPDFNSQINSSKLDLSDFMPFLKKTSVVTTKSKSKTIAVKTITHAMKGLADCNVHVQLKTKQLVFRKFQANNVAASVSMNNNYINLKNGSLDHAGGILSINGEMKNLGSNDSVSLHSKMTNMDINKVMIAFNNFGQSGITHDNIKGKLTADIVMNGSITEKATLNPSSINGSIDFNIRNGELIQFEPVQKISQVAFKSRDFSDVHFAELKDKFDISGTQVKVNRMEIHSNVLTMFVEGIYDFKKGTDMSIQVPLSNLKSKDPAEALRNQGTNSKTGMSVRLRAKTGDDGKLKVTWDPFKKALNGRKIGK
ncbi:MAG: hypothetical protein C5B59_07660 [Bacteroidetes bacterium]|nr:MAG: hypothetical protein C5B59_07660 [Bacteroidota bacterium]